MTNAELQIAIDAIRNATADGSITNVMEADIMDALKSNNIPLSGTTEGNPVTGYIEFENGGYIGEDGGLYLCSSPTLDGTNTNLYLRDNGFSIYNITTESSVGISYGQDNSVPDAITIFRNNGQNLNFKGLEGSHDFSSIDPTNKLIYAQRSYVERPETLINALNNCDSTQLDTIKTILGII